MSGWIDKKQRLSVSEWEGPAACVCVGALTERGATVLWRGKSIANCAGNIRGSYECKAPDIQIWSDIGKSKRTTVYLFEKL